MAEYIEREALIAFLNEDMVFCKHALDESPFSKGVQTGLNAGINYATVLAAADVVERNAFNRLMERYKKATGRMPNGVMRQMVEVKRGRWENIVYNPVLRKMEATCSSCKVRGEIRVKGNCCGFVVPNSDFCPECGADMREVDDAN